MPPKKSKMEDDAPKRASANKKTPEELMQARLTSGGKSVARHIMHHRYPSAFLPQGHYPPDHDKITDVFHDTLQLLRGARRYDMYTNKTSPFKTWQDILCAFRNTVQAEVDHKRPHKVTFYFVCDKKEFVWKAKAVEQNARREKNQHVPHDTDLNFDVNGELPECWDDALADAFHVRRILRFIFKTLLTHDDYRVPVNELFDVVVDGHCLEPEDIPTHMLFEGRHTYTSEEMRRAVLRLAYSGDRLCIEFPEHLKNEIGEADFTVLWIADRLTATAYENPEARQPVINVKSVDTDTMWLLLEYYANNQGQTVYWQPMPSLTWPAYKQVPIQSHEWWKPPTRSYPLREGKSQQWVDIGALYRAINADPTLRDGNNDPCLSLHLVYHAAGADYTSGLDGVASYHFFNSFLAVRPGRLFDAPDPITGFPKINDKGFHMLFRNACILAAHVAKEGRKKAACKRSGEAYVEVPFDKSIVQQAIAEKWELKMPTDLSQRKLHCELALCSVIQIFAELPNRYSPFRHHEPPLDKFGYCRVDRTQPMTRDNLARCETAADVDVFGEDHAEAFNKLYRQAKEVAVEQDASLDDISSVSNDTKKRDYLTMTLSYGEATIETAFGIIDDFKDRNVRARVALEVSEVIESYLHELYDATA